MTSQVTSYPSKCGCDAVDASCRAAVKGFVLWRPAWAEIQSMPDYLKVELLNALLDNEVFILFAENVSRD